MGDLRADLKALCAAAHAAGRRTVSVAAILNALGPDPAAPVAHEIVFDPTGWRLAHPHTCKTADCSVAAAARHQLAASPYTPGRYVVRLGPSGGLSFHRLTSALDGGA